MFFQKTHISCSTSKHRAWSEFTLVELLVVIAIISILSALLLPAVQKVMESSRTIHCVSNMKQMGMMQDAYHSLHGYWTASRRPDYWHATLWKEVAFPDSQSMYSAWVNKAIDKTIFWCPKNTRKTGYWTVIGYGQNVCLPPAKRTDSWGMAERTPCRPSRIRIPSCTLLLGDTDKYWHLSFGDSYAITHTFTYVHNGRANALYCDFHVQTANENDLLDNFEQTPYTTNGTY